MAREVPFGIRYEGAGWAAGPRASYTVRSTKTGTKVTGSVKKTSKKKPKVESTSYRGKELTKAERAEIRRQNEAAETMKSKDLDRVESGRRAARTRKIRQEEREDYAFMVGNKAGYKKGEKVGKAKGAAGTVALGSAIYSLVEKKKREDKKNKKKKK